MHLHRKHVVFCINLRPRTRFGTRGSEVQILSPRPTKKKRYQRFRTREIAFLWTLPRAGQIPASTVAVDCCYLPPTVAKRITRAGIVAASPAGCSLARPPLALRSGSPSLSSRPILSCSQAQGVGNKANTRIQGKQSLHQPEHLAMLAFGSPIYRQAGNHLYLSLSKQRISTFIYLLKRIHFELYCRHRKKVSCECLLSRRKLAIRHGSPDSCARLTEPRCSRPTHM